ncbi:MAG: MinD/ParA family protein [Phycisphaerae bacterium]|jgi:flagellar biosynthesis protein FlhG|nr:MinD/ParA family protein [Phycisphaerae bacterium]
MFGREDHARRVDQAHQLRQLMASSGGVPAAKRGHVIAVTSGKGGVGKTLLAANLSIALAARGHRVALFDMDMGLANADIVLGVEVAWTWRDVLAGRRSLDEVIIHGPGGITLVAGASGVSQMANLSEFERHQLIAIAGQAAELNDVVVFDCGAGISHNVVSIASFADTILVVTTPEPTSVTDAYAMIKAFAQEQGRSRYTEAAAMGVLVNLAESRREGRDTYERLAGVAARFLHIPVTDYGYILRDEHVSAAVRQRCPVVLRYPRCSASSCLMASAGRLSRELGRAEEQQSLFYRVMNMFL